MNERIEMAAAGWMGSMSKSFEMPVTCLQDLRRFFA
jgi:hypothetical protein